VDWTLINILMNLATWVVLIIGGLLLRNYLPSYFQEKGKNLATKEDIREITDKVEAVKAQYVREIELFKYDIALLQKRRDLSCQVVDLINRYKEISSPQDLRSFEQEYWKLVPWIPTEILRSLNLLFSGSVPAQNKPDIKDIIIEVRKAILKEESGDFKGTDIVHFVGFGKIGE